MNVEALDDVAQHEELVDATKFARTPAYKKSVDRIVATGLSEKEAKALLSGD